MARNTNCTIITIGDELLIGQTIDTNSAWIAQQLNPIGIDVIRRVAVGDNKNDIIEALNTEQLRSDILIITGGLGPTSDDITKPLLCEYFGGKLIQNDEVLTHIESFFRRRNRPMLQVNINQALVPDVCKVLFNDVGTAPGMLFEKEGKVFISLPGVPFEMQYLITNHVLDYLKTHFTTHNIIHKTIVTCGEGESFIAERLKQFEIDLPKEIRLAYLPNMNIVKLRLTAKDTDESEVENYFQQLKRLVLDIMVSDSDKELEGVIGELLKTKNLTLSIAESCTGGRISASITSISGSSAYFKGGMVPYSIESKENVLGVKAEIIDEKGVVSEDTVKEMAIQCRDKFKSDFSLSVSGYLEKGDHDNAVWIGFASQKMVAAKKIVVPFDRQKNAVLTINTALNLLREFILND